MTLNSDFSKRVLIHSDELDWIASPMPGVDRRMLDRIGDEVARATSIVRYAPGSAFSAHTHTGGEEFIVLDGVFEDEHAHSPAGTYVRNPPTTFHTPGSEGGCTIFVKLWQFDMDDRTQFSVKMSDGLQSVATGHAQSLLHEDERERVTYEELDPGVGFSRAVPGGCEVLILAGSASSDGDEMRKGSWLRLPEGSTLDLKAAENGTTFWMKSGHLPYARAPQV